MVIRGNTRGNGSQLAQYLIGGEANDRIQILEVDGRLNATDRYLSQTLHSMSLTAELSKSQKGLYHAQINPAYREDRAMTTTDWLQAADILGHELGLSEQRRVIVLHTKKGRTHAHVVFERYDQQTGRVVSDSFSRLAQDRARKEMERVFEHQPTPHRNQHRPELKETLTNLWNETDTGKDFVRAVHDSGYLLAEGVPRHPFMVVDENGRSFDLVRQLKGIRIKEVRQRMRHETLMPEKDAIELMRHKQAGSSEAGNAGQQRDTETDKAKRTAALFWHTKQDVTIEDIETHSRERMKDRTDSFRQTQHDIVDEGETDNGLEKKKRLAREFFLNADELTGTSAHNADATTAPQQTDTITEEKDNVRTNSQRDESRQRQQKIAEQFADNNDDASQPNVKLDSKRHQDILKAFMQSEDELVDQMRPTTEVATSAQRQQTAATQFLDNEELTTAAPTTDDNEIQKLMQEQKDIRERKRHRTKRRTH